MKKYNRPSVFNEFKKYLSNVKNDIKLFNFKDFKKLFNTYLSFLKELYKENYKKNKEYSDEHIAEQIFCYEIGNVKEFTKYSILAIIKTFLRIEDNIEYFCNKNESELLYKEIRLFSELLSDSIVFINLSNLKYKGQESHFGYFKTNFVYSLQTYVASQKLFHENIDIKNWSIKAIRNTSIFLIRQSIELRLKNAIGVGNVIDLNGNPIKLRHDMIIDFIKNFESYFIFPIKFSLLNKIYKWTNVYIHNGIYDYLWLIDWAFIILNPLFTPYRDKITFDQIMKGEFSGKSKTTAFSLFGSIKVQRDFFKSNMKTKLVEFISNNTGISSDNIRINFLSSPESMLYD